MTTDPMLLLAQQHSRELQAEARRHALVRLARCCQPSALRRAVSSARDAVAARLPHRGTDACCA